MFIGMVAVIFLRSIKADSSAECEDYESREECSSCLRFCANFCESPASLELFANFKRLTLYDAELSFGQPCDKMSIVDDDVEWRLEVNDLKS